MTFNNESPTIQDEYLPYINGIIPEDYLGTFNTEAECQEKVIFWALYLGIDSPITCVLNDDNKYDMPTNSYLKGFGSFTSVSDCNDRLYDEGTPSNPFTVE